MKFENKSEAWGFVVALWFVAAVLLMLQGACGGVSLETQAAQIEQRYSAAVSVTAVCVQDDGQTTGWNGSGVIVSETRLLTAGHVVETAPNEACIFTVEDADGNEYLAKPLVAIPQVDLASMELISPAAKFRFEGVRFGLPPWTGEIVCSATGFPRREHRCGQVMKPKLPPGDILMNLVVEPGNSGSGLYNMKHELVGIIVHTYPNRGNGQYVTGGATSLAPLGLQGLLP